MVQRGNQGGQLRILTNDQARKIHLSSLEILESVGMSSQSVRIMKVFADAGADVDYKTRRIRIPQYLVEESLKKAPCEVVFCGRNRDYDILLEGSRIYFGMGGTPVPYIRDVRTQELRRPTKKDVAEATRLGDALPNMKFIMSIAGAFDVPPQVEYEHEWEALLNNTEKPILYSCPGSFAARNVLEMATTIAGDVDELRKRPTIALYAETAPPLQFGESNENIIEFARAGLPVTNGPSVLLGASGPMTIAGAVAESNAETLAAITLCQVVRPHTPVIYASWACLLDPRTAREAMGSAEFAIGTSVFNAAMGQFYDLPTYGFGGCSDSKLPDAQAGAEIMMSAMIAAQSGVNLIHDCGYLASAGVGSMEMTVICNEVAGMVSRFIEGARVDDDALAVDVIKNVGPGGHFMSQAHTLKHLREVYMPTLFDRTSEITWLKRGKADIRDVACAKVQEILREHVPAPLPSEVQMKLREIVRAAENRLVKAS